MNNTSDWRPTASLENIKLRARVLAEIRAFFSARDVIEVETPLLSLAGSTDPYLESFTSHYQGPLFPAGQTVYLQTSPEFAMKRLLAAGSGAIYQICKAFRNGEAGGQHNPEFTMLEWYRPGFDHHVLMDEVETLIDAVLKVGPARRITYRELFLEYVELDPFELSAADARVCLQARDVNPPELADAAIDDWLALIMTHLIEPELGPGPVFVYDFPASQAMLARVAPTEPPVAQRFELYINGMELANGFYELSDAAEQRRRFQADLKQRQQLGLDAVMMNQALIDALESGLPDCAGVALGLDRLLMLAAGAEEISGVLVFSVDRC